MNVGEKVCVQLRRVVAVRGIDVFVVAKYRGFIGRRQLVVNVPRREHIAGRRL